MRITIPNQITIGRLGLAGLFFLVMSFYSAVDEQRRWLLVVAFWVFLTAALADIVDGALARWMKQVTSFGRVVDPVVDKVMVLGAFVFLASPLFSAPTPGGLHNLAGIQPWMVVLILMRELLVSAIRAQRESVGDATPAIWAGKLKMFVQCTTICVVLAQIAWFRPVGQLMWLPPLCVWTCLVITALSAIPYVREAYTFLFSGEALGGNEPLRIAPAPDTAEPAPTTPLSGRPLAPFEDVHPARGVSA